MGVKFESKCKVCNSKFRNMIEDLHTQGMSPEKIYNYLQNLTDPLEKSIIEREDINPSSVRRHMAKHFDLNDGAKIKLAETHSRVEQSRDAYRQGVGIYVDKINTLAHMIDVAMIRLEEVEDLHDKTKHQFTIQYMNSIKGMVESLAKLTGDLKQEGTIDINFFSNEIVRFADIVLSTIRTIDTQLGLNNQLEYTFAQEFKRQWDTYQLRQQMIFNGELSPSDGEKERSVNTFNEN